MKKLAVVTGANKGIGFEICRQLALEGVKVILTARDETKGKAACRQLEKGHLDVQFYQLDVTKPDEIQSLATYIETEFGRLDILINNAGIFIDRDKSALEADLEKIKLTMETNAWGALLLCQAFIPLMQKNNYGRIVNVSSSLGMLDSMGGGYPGYRCSKVVMNAFTCMLADEMKGSNILINSASPGWVRTDMGGPNAPGLVEEGADTIVWLALLPDNGPTGGFFRKRARLRW